MTESTQPVLGDVFAPVDALALDVRLTLATLLAVPGRAPAILPGEIAAEPVPADPGVRASVCDAIRAGLDASLLTRRAEHRLDTIAPVLAGRDDADDAVVRFLPAPLHAELASCSSNGSRHSAGTVRPTPASAVSALAIVATSAATTSSWRS